MNVKIADLMSSSVVTVEPHHTVSHVRALFEKHGFHAVPVVDCEDHPVGIVTTLDLVFAKSDESPVKTLLKSKVWTIPQYNGPHQAARLMRKHRVNHVVVTHEKKIVGILSSFDLLQLVEERRFVMKNAPA